MTTWITDRQPMACDADPDGEVAIPSSILSGFSDWRHVALGSPWSHTAFWKPPTITAEPQAPQPEPRRFASLTRTALPKDCITLDAIDQDGRAWWLVLGDDAAPDEWTELLPLPTREEQP